MGKILPFRKPKKRRDGYRPQGRAHPPRRFPFNLLFFAAFFVLVFVWGQGGFAPAAEESVYTDAVCRNPHIIDGDSLRCGGHEIRLSGIDAPEISACKEGRRCTRGNGPASKAYLQSIARGAVACRRVDTDHYGRMVAECMADGVNLSCAMADAGHAVFRYRAISCP